MSNENTVSGNLGRFGSEVMITAGSPVAAAFLAAETKAAQAVAKHGYEQPYNQFMETAYNAMGEKPSFQLNFAEASKAELLNPQIIASVKPTAPTIGWNL